MPAEIIDECDRMVQMINLLLEIAEIDSGAVRIEGEPADICHIASTAFDLYATVAEDSGIAISMDIPPISLTVRGDINKLGRMFVNLLDNALKYTPDGGRVLIRVERSENFVGISIADTGIGIEEKHLSHIFDKFYRIEESRSLPGHGLGLSFVRSVVQAHGGTIDVESKPKSGTTFTVALPILDTP
jgi:signal transduction histidine kinase